MLPSNRVVSSVRNRISELTLVFLVCLAPWAFGSVEAWAQLGLYIGIGLLAVLGFGRRTRSWPAGLLVRLPGLALAGLVLLAIFQAVPLGRVLAPWISPAAAAANLLPDRPEQELHPSGPPVAFPATTISIDPDSTLQTAAQLTAACLLFHCVLGMRHDARMVTLFAKFVVLNSVLLALFAIIQSLTWNGQIYWLRPVMVETAWTVGGPFLSHSHLAAYLNLGLGLALGLILSENSRDIFRRDSTKLWTVYAAGIIAIGIVTSHSRSGFLGSLAAGTVFVYYLRSRLTQMGVGLVIAVALFGLALVLLTGSTSYASRLLTILDFADQGYQDRLEVWRAAIRAWWARPLWGAGFGAFPVAVIPYLMRDLPVFFARAENEYVDILVESGAVGLILVLTFMGGIGGLARRALAGARGRRERGFVAGAGFGLIALAVQSCADFGSHIPAVGVAALVVCAMVARTARVCVPPPAPSLLPDSETKTPIDSLPVRFVLHRSLRARLDRLARRPPFANWRTKIFAGPWTMGRGPQSPQLASEIGSLATVMVAALLVGHGTRDAWIEHRLASVGIPLPGSLMPTVGTMETVTWGLDEWRDALQDAVARRPNWTEGYVRLGLIHLGLYRQKAKEWLLESAADPREINRQAEPLWLLGAVEEQPEQFPHAPAKTEILSLEPILDHLVPATRCFLEARRCSPFLALPHAELAALNYLLVDGDHPSTYAGRALRLAGNNGELIAFLAQVAVQCGDRSLAAQCWRKELEVSPSRWPEVADLAGPILTADELLTQVVIDGPNAVRFAERVYQAADLQPARTQFLNAALSRLALDRKLAPADRLYFEAHAAAGLNFHKQACETIESALALEPDRGDWREEYINWLFRWGRPDEAHKQALIGRYFSPNSQAFRTAVDRSAEALARDVREKDGG
jgi:O-antigen ligase